MLVPNGSPVTLVSVTRSVVKRTEICCGSDGSETLREGLIPVYHHFQSFQDAVRKFSSSKGKPNAVYDQAELLAAALIKLVVDMKGKPDVAPADVPDLDS